MPSRQKSPTRRLVLRIAGVVALLAGVALAYGIFIEPYRLVVRRLSLPCAGLRGTSVRIAFFSDIETVGSARREKVLARELAAFAPDLVLIAGDLLGTRPSVHDAAAISAADRFLASLPATSGRFIAPGEEESDAGPALRAAFRAGGAAELLSNEERTLVVRGERISIFGADLQTAPGPWTFRAAAGHAFAVCETGAGAPLLAYGAETPPQWGPIELRFAFLRPAEDAALDVRFAWRSGETSVGGMVGVGGYGFRLVADRYRPDVRLYSYQPDPHDLPGKRFSGFVPPVGVWCRARVRLIEKDGASRVKARFWKESELEPKDWPIEALDARPERLYRGTVALGGAGGSDWVSDLVVTARDDVSCDAANKGAGCDGAQVGPTLLRESFADPTTARARWGDASPLAAWLRAPPADAHARILLAHSPDVMLDVETLGGLAPDLILAGHTHGGQIRLPLIGAFYTRTRLGRTFDTGLFLTGRNRIYITSGVGTAILPVRLLTPPELALITLDPVRGSGRE